MQLNNVGYLDQGMFSGQEIPSISHQNQHTVDIHGGRIKNNVGFSPFYQLVIKKFTCDFYDKALSKH
jgi:hypothetical protein